MGLRVSEILDASPRLPHSCGGCVARWSGYNTTHCGTCHRTFGGVTYFDDHRRAGECRNPETMGLVLKNRTYPYWGSPDERREGTYPPRRDESWREDRYL